MNRILKNARVYCIGFFIIALSGCAEEAQDRYFQTDATVQVIVVPVQFTNEQTRIEAVGTSRAIQSVTITPVTSGEVVAINFEPGQRVEKGEILIELDRRNEVLAVELAGIRLQDAQQLYDRYQRTAGSGAILPTTIDAASTALESARVQLAQARIALDDRTIKAPFTGHIGIPEVDPGDRVTPGTVITTLDNRDALLVSFEVPEIMIGVLETGDEIAIITWNNLATVAHGEVVEIGSRIDPLTRTFVARARVENQNDELRPGMSFRVSLDIEGKTYPVVPEIAVQWGTDGSYVWAVAESQAKRVPAKIIQRQQGRVLIDANFVEGDLIVVEGIQRMYEGIKVLHSVRTEDDYRQEVNRSVKVES